VNELVRHLHVGGHKRVQPFDRGYAGLARRRFVLFQHSRTRFPDIGPSYRNYAGPESRAGEADRLSRQAQILVYTASMRVVLKSNNPVILSYATHVLEESGIEALVFDTHASIMDGSTIMVPRRLMVADEDFNRAEKLLRDAVPEAMP